MCTVLIYTKTVRFRHYFLPIQSTKFYLVVCDAIIYGCVRDIISSINTAILLIAMDQIRMYRCRNEI